MKRMTFFFLLFISSLFIGNPVWALTKISKWRACQKDCFSNLRILEGAIELYNMDHSKMIDSALPGRDYEDFEKILVNEGYLKDIIYIPDEKCSYGFVNMCATGTVFCKNHGNIENKTDDEFEKPILPKYDTSLEKPFSDEYLNKQLSNLRDKERKRAISDFIFNISRDPLHLVIVIIFFIIIITIGGIIFNRIFNLKKNKDKAD